MKGVLNWEEGTNSRGIMRLRVCFASGNSEGNSNTNRVASDALLAGFWLAESQTRGLETVEKASDERVTMSSRQNHVREEEEDAEKKHHATKKTKLEYTIARCRENPRRYSPYVREFLR